MPSPRGTRPSGPTGRLRFSHVRVPSTQGTYVEPYEESVEVHEAMTFISCVAGSNEIADVASVGPTLAASRCAKSTSSSPHCATPVTM